MTNQKSKRFTLSERLAAYRNLPRFFRLIWFVCPSLTLCNIFVRLLQAITPLALLSVGKYIIDEAVAITQKKNFDHVYIWKLIIIEFFLMIFLISVGKIVSLIDDLLAERLTNETTNMIMAHAGKLDLLQFENSFFYDKLERARQQTTGRAIMVTHVFSQIQDILTTLTYVAVLAIFSPWIILILFTGVLPAILGEFYFNAKNYQLIRSQTEERRKLDYLNLIASSDSTAKEVRLFGLSEFLINRFKKIAALLYNAKYNFGLRKAVIGSLINIPGAIAFYIVFAYIIQQVIIGKISIGGLTFLLGTIRQLGSLVQNSAKRFSAIAQGAIYLTDFFDFFNIKPVMEPPSHPRPFPQKMTAGFVFENVGFKYSNSSKWANRHISFTLKPGEKLALVGENGAGKSTLIKLLVRLYDPTEGRILLDGYDLKEYDPTEIRNNMGVIFQDFIRYQMTCAENIGISRLDRMNDISLVEASAKQSKAHELIDKMPGRYQQILGHYFEGGFELSGGEWQKIALSRAYMRNAEIVILDEPTAALDARSEYEVFKRFSEITKEKTAVLISHRFSTVRMADRIIVLNQGELAEIGTHVELLEKDGRYAELFRLQADGYK